MGLAQQKAIVPKHCKAFVSVPHLDTLTWSAAAQLAPAELLPCWPCPGSPLAASLPKQRQSLLQEELWNLINSAPHPQPCDFSYL